MSIQTMNSITKSIYVPRMAIYHTEESVRHIMNYYMVGTVSYVDFTPINKKPGFGEDGDSVRKSAFIHFSTTNNIGGWDVIEAGQLFKLQITKGEYWLCFKNKNPVKRTLMNIHQVVESGRHVESLVKQQAEKIDILENKIIHLQSIVLQLIGGLYCQTTQRNSICEMLDQLTGKPVEDDYIIGAERDTNKWANYPTTRQGDDCENRLDAIERILGVKTQNQELEDDNSTINSELIADKTWKENYEDIQESINQEERERKQMAREERWTDKSIREDRWDRRERR